MPHPDSRLLQWRKALKSKDVANVIPNSAIDELFAIAKQRIEFYYRTPKRLSPSALSRELGQMAKGLERAAKAIEAVGLQGMVNVYAASCANSDPLDFAPHLHSAYILQMSRWAKRAAITVDADSAKVIHGKRGPTPDLELRSLVSVLAHQYGVMLAIQPRHSAHVETGEGTSTFNEFVKAAIADFAPAGAAPKWTQVDEAIREELH
jgi:hypothetical protein